jgi:virginiamycin A acetyltransferase
LRSTKKSDLPFDHRLIRPAFFLSQESPYSSYSVGKFSYGVNLPLVFSNATGDKSGSLKIGKFCSIGSGVTILLGGEHRPDWVTTYPFSVLFKKFDDFHGASTTKGDVVIGNDVWIGMNVLILSSVTVGDGAVIGACSVVTRDVEPYAIVAGNPARLIRKRFDQAVINKLLEIKWWDWDAGRITENMPLLLSNRINEFVEKNSAKKS